MNSLDLCWAASIKLTALATLLPSVEMLARPRMFAEGGILNWDALGSRKAALRWSPAIWKGVFGARGIRVVLVLRLAACLVLLAVSGAWSDTLLLAIALSCSMLLSFRNLLGADGGDQMTVILLASLFGGAAVGSDRGRLVAICFIAAQSCLAYFISGFAKALGPMWRSGAAVERIFNSRTYGSAQVSAWLRAHPIVGRSLTWSVVLIECTFPLMFVSPAPVRLAFLAWGLTFHLLNAVVMGLNNFFWAFIATYPALWFASSLVHARAF